MFLDECHQAATERKFRNQWVAIHKMIVRKHLANHPSNSDTADLLTTEMGDIAWN